LIVELTGDHSLFIAPGFTHFAFEAKWVKSAGTTQCIVTGYFGLHGMSLAAGK